MLALYFCVCLYARKVFVHLPRREVTAYFCRIDLLLFSYSSHLSS